MRTPAQETIIRQLVTAAQEFIEKGDAVCKYAKYALSQAVRPVVENKVTAYDINQTLFAAQSVLMPLNHAFETVMRLGTVEESRAAELKRTAYNRAYFMEANGALNGVNLNVRSL